MTGGAKERNCDGQIETRALFARVRGRKVDRNFPIRKFVAGIAQRGSDPIE